MHSAQIPEADLLLEGYLEMAADQQREAEAEAWCDAMIADGMEAE